MSTTRNPHGIHNGVAFHLIALAAEVARYEQEVRQSLASVARIADLAGKQLDNARQLNALGELQGTGPRLDTNVAAYEAAVDAFQSAVTWLHPASTFASTDQPQTFQDMFNREVAQSVRLQEMISK